MPSLVFIFTSRSDSMALSRRGQGQFVIVAHGMVREQFASLAEILEDCERCAPLLFWMIAPVSLIGKYLARLHAAAIDYPIAMRFHRGRVARRRWAAGVISGVIMGGALDLSSVRRAELQELPHLFGHLWPRLRPAPLVSGPPLRLPWAGLMISSGCSAHLCIKTRGPGRETPTRCGPVGSPRTVDAICSTGSMRNGTRNEYIGRRLRIKAPCPFSLSTGRGSHGAPQSVHSI